MDVRGTIIKTAKIAMTCLTIVYILLFVLNFRQCMGIADRIYAMTLIPSYSTEVANLEPKEAIDEISESGPIPYCMRTAPGKTLMDLGSLFGMSRE